MISRSFLNSGTLMVIILCDFLLWSLLVKYQALPLQPYLDNWRSDFLSSSLLTGLHLILWPLIYLILNCLLLLIFRKCPRFSLKLLLSNVLYLRNQLPVTLISVADPECLSRIQKRQQKRGVSYPVPFFVALNITKLKIILFLNRQRTKFGPIIKNFKTFHPKNCR